MDFFFSSRRRHTRLQGDWSSDVCSSDLAIPALIRAHGEAERIMMAAQAEQAIAEWPRDAAKLVVVRPVAEREATFAVQEMDRYLRAGYDATKRALET